MGEIQSPPEFFKELSQIGELSSYLRIFITSQFGSTAYIAEQLTLQNIVFHLFNQEALTLCQVFKFKNIV